MFRGMNYVEEVDSGFMPTLPRFCRENAKKAESAFWRSIAPNDISKQSMIVSFEQKLLEILWF